MKQFKITLEEIQFIFDRLRKGNLENGLPIVDLLRKLPVLAEENPAEDKIDVKENN